MKDRVDTTALIWLGLSVGCAKCHSHKYDPISQTEYYQLFAFFNQTADADRGDDAPKQTLASPYQSEQRKDLLEKLASARIGLERTSDDPAAAWYGVSRSR